MKNNALNYTFVGAFVLAMAAALLVAVGLLTGRTGAADVYYTSYGNVAGILRGTKVMYEGFTIGQVETIDPVRDDGQTRFRVHMAVRKGWTIPRDAVATVTASGLLSAIAIDIRGGKSAESFEPGATIPGSMAGNIFAVATNIAQQMSELSETSLKPLLQALTRNVDAIGGPLAEHAPELIGNLLAMTGDLARQTPEITTNVRELTGELVLTSRRVNGELLGPANTQSLQATLNNLQRASTGLVQFVGELSETRRAIDQVMRTVDQTVARNSENVGESMTSLRHTLQTVSRNIDSIVYNLDGMSRNMHEFSRMVRQNPGLLLSGARRDESR
ncbi:MAG: MCE family protein [Alphaproteobacteria bacterium]|nr:MCE family protein [Alphaproteobacteria bacterium]